MRGLDTNVLVRYLTNDDPTFFDLAREILEGSEDRGQPLFVSLLVLCELTWVLRSKYRYSREDLLNALESLLESSVLMIERRDLARQALGAYRRGRADFADCLIGQISLAAGCTDTATFDTGLRGDLGFTVIQDFYPEPKPGGWMLMEPR